MFDQPEDQQHIVILHLILNYRLLHQPIFMLHNLQLQLMYLSKLVKKIYPKP
jgi:hypothetical protein